MTADLFPHPWLVNNLLDASFVDQKTAELTNQPLPYGLADWLAQHFKDLGVRASVEKVGHTQTKLKPVAEP